MLFRSAVTRTMRDGGEVLNPEECDTVEDAMRAITIDAAWQTCSDDTIGSIAVGKYADLVVLDADPLLVDPRTIGSIGVIATYLAGRRVEA